MPENLGRSYLLGTYGLAVQGGSRFLFTVIVGRELGVETLGVVATLLAIGVFASLVWPASAGLAASRYLAQLRRQQRTTDPTAALNRQVGLSLVLIAAVTTAAGAAVSHDAMLALGCGASSVAYGAYSYARGAQIGLSRLPWVASWDTVCGVLILGGALVVIRVDESLLLMPVAVGYAAFAVACWPRSRRDLPQAHWRDRSILRLIGANVVALLTGAGMLNLTMLTAHMFGTATETGMFAAAFALATPPLMLGQSLQQVLVPHFSRDHTPEERRRDLRGVLVRLGGPMTLAFLAMIAIAPLLLGTFYGAEYVAGSAEMRWLLVGVLVASLGLVPAAALIAAADTRPLIRATITGFVLGSALMFGLGPELGPWASILGYNAAAVVTAAMSFTAVWFARDRR